MQVRHFISVAALALVLAGCGGSQGFDPTRGEGSIPIGRAQTTDAKAVTVRLRSGGSTYTIVPEAGGTIYASTSMLAGDYNVAVEAAGGYTETFDIQPGPDPTDSFDVQILPSKRQADVTSVQLEHPASVELRVKDSLKLKVKVNGTNVNGLDPSYWTSGGIGSVNNGGVFRARAVGTGTVTVSVLGRTSTIQVTVLP